MKSIVASIAALSFAGLSFAGPAFAQEWPKQDWHLLRVKPTAQQAPASTKRDGGAYPPEAWMTAAAAVQLGGPAPGSRQNVAVNLDSLNRVGDKVEVRYFVWPDEKSNYTEITSRIDCSKTGEQVVAWREYDQDFAYVRTGGQGARRTDARARAIASYACHAPRGPDVGGKSLPELVQGG